MSFNKCEQAYLAVGTEVGSRNLKSDLIVCEFVHLLSQKVGFSHQSVGFDDLLSEPRQTLTKKLIPGSHTCRQTDTVMHYKAGIH